MMKGYDNYIDSNEEWIGLVPKSWNKTQLRYISSIVKGKKPKEDHIDYKEGLVPYLSMEYLRNQTESPTYVEPDDPSITLVDVGDLLILWDGSKAGEIVKAKVGALSSTMGKIHLESDKININFLTYYLKSAERYIQANTIGMGIPHVSGEVLRSLQIVFPTFPEQSKIAEYLDYQTALIDQLIQQKENLVALLKDKRQAVINEAVTKGIHPNVPMKHSGIDWLGEVPADWDVTKLKFLAKLNPSKSEIDDLINGDDFVAFLPMEKVGEDWSYDKDSVAKYKDVSSGLTYFKEGDIIMAKITPCFENGKATILERLTNGLGFGSTEFHTIRPLKIDRRYLFYVTRSDYFMSNGESFMTGSAGQKRVPTSFVSDFYVPVPDPNQQIEIANYIEEFIGRSNHLSVQLDLQIEKLKEYRQSIISEAVTGKIDVRHWQPPTQN